MSFNEQLFTDIKQLLDDWVSAVTGQIWMHSVDINGDIKKLHDRAELRALQFGITDWERPFEAEI